MCAKLRSNEMKLELRAGCTIENFEEMMMRK
jgi:hypothetical protein